MSIERKMLIDEKEELITGIEELQE